MKNITVIFIILLFLSFNNVYAESVPEDMYGKWLRLSEEKDGKNCKKLTIDGKTKCYSIHISPSVAFYDKIEPDYIIINKEENFYENRLAWADFPEYGKPIDYKKENGIHYFRVGGETTADDAYTSYHAIKQINNDYLYHKDSYYIREQTSKKINIPVIKFESLNENDY